MNQRKIHSSSVKVALIFLFIGILWIAMSDKLALLLANNLEQLSAIQTLKGWVFIGVSTIVVFFLVNSEARKKEIIINTLNSKSKWQKLLIYNLPDTKVYLINSDFDLLFQASGNTQEYNATLEMPVKSADRYCSNGIATIPLKSLLGDVFNGTQVALANEFNYNFYEIHGIPVTDEKSNSNAILLIVLNRTQQRKLVQQINNERRSFAKLSDKYHSLNSELVDSYNQLQTYNKELIENKERYSAFIQQTSEAVYRIEMKRPVDLALSADMQVAAIISTCYLAEYNNAFAEIYSHETDKNHIGKTHYEIYPENNHVISQELINELVQHNYVLKDLESVEYDAHGRTRYFFNNIVGIIEGNKLIRFWGTKLETTRQKKYERELLLAKKAAEESDKLKSAFLANMSHEIRTPLNGILGFSELICNSGVADAKKEKYFTIIQASNQQLLRIINDILDISRLQTGQISIYKTEFPLNKLIDEIEASMKIEIMQKKKEIDFIVSKTLSEGDDNVKTDRERLYQIITNLASNAIKFTEQGSVTIAYERKNKSVVEFSVSDTGIGIPGEYLGSIFDQFRQVEEFASRSYGGTGLGLSISKGLVELLGGYIAVESEENVGSTFKFNIKIS
jgi:signal transduction histidine kinase